MTKDITNPQKLNTSFYLAYFRYNTQKSKENKEILVKSVLELQKFFRTKKETPTNLNIDEILIQFLENKLGYNELLPKLYHVINKL